MQTGWLEAVTVGSPARAGIGPTKKAIYGFKSGFPRASGDRPPEAPMLTEVVTVPPRERGDRPELCGVASAGWDGFPRASGDRPC